MEHGGFRGRLRRPTSSDVSAVSDSVWHPGARYVENLNLICGVCQARRNERASVRGLKRWAAAMLVLAGSVSGCSDSVDTVPDIRVAVVDGRDETQAMAFAFAAELEETGLEVEIVGGGPSAAYARLARGEADIFFGGYVEDLDLAVYETVKNSVLDLGPWTEAGWGVVGDSQAIARGPERVGLPVDSPSAEMLKGVALKEWPSAEFVYDDLASPVPTEVKPGVDVEIVWLPSRVVGAQGVEVLTDALPLPKLTPVHVVVNPVFASSNEALRQWLSDLEVPVAVASELLAALPEDVRDRSDAMVEWLKSADGQAFASDFLADIP